MDYLIHARPDHEYNAFQWNELLEGFSLYYLWPFSMLSTLFYSWQYYDMVKTAANPLDACSGFWIRTSLVITTVLGNILATGFHDYCTALTAWYLEPKHFDSNLANHYLILQNQVYYFVAGFVCLSCFGSAVFLGGTIYWAHKMTQARNETELQAGSLNYFTVFGHMGLLIVQITFVCFTVSSYTNLEYSYST
jgi:hypothetical protein